MSTLGRGMPGRGIWSRILAILEWLKRILTGGSQGTGGSRTPQEISAEVERWISWLSAPKTWDPFALFGARVGAAPELRAAFLERCSDTAALTEELREVVFAVRAISAEIDRERKGKGPLNPPWRADGLEPWFLQMFVHGPSAGRFVMFGAYVGRSSARRETFLQLTEDYGDLPEPLSCAADAVRLLSSLRTFSAEALIGPEPRPQIVSRPLVQRAAVLAGVVVALIVTGFGTVQLMRAADWESYSTKVGGHRRVELRDGSTVELNTDSTIRYRDSKDEQVVQLVSGEARFEVVHDEARKFVVMAGDTEIRDVGTAFTVRLWPDGKVEIVVAEGEVEVRHRTKPNWLGSALSSRALPARAGHRVADESGTISLSEMSSQEVADHDAWRNNEIFVTEMPIADVVSELNRYSERKIRVIDNELGRKTLNGRVRFDPRDLDGTVAKLKRVVAIRTFPVMGKDGQMDIAIRGERAGNAADDR